MFMEQVAGCCWTRWPNGLEYATLPVDGYNAAVDRYAAGHQQGAVVIRTVDFGYRSTQFASSTADDPFRLSWPTIVPH